jgi:hypothetical protein
LRSAFGCALAFGREEGLGPHSYGTTKVVPLRKTLDALHMLIGMIPNPFERGLHFGVKTFQRC